MDTDYAGASVNVSANMIAMFAENSRMSIVVPNVRKDMNNMAVNAVKNHTAPLDAPTVSVH